MVHPRPKTLQGEPVAKHGTPLLIILNLVCKFDIKEAHSALSNQLFTLHWRLNDHDGVSNHQPHGCLLNRLFRRRSKKTSKLRVIGLCVGISPGPVNSPHKRPVTRKMFPFDDVIMKKNVRGRTHTKCKHPVQDTRRGWLICPEGRVSSLNKSNPVQQALKQNIPIKYQLFSKK